MDSEKERSQNINDSAAETEESSIEKPIAVDNSQQIDDMKDTVSDQNASLSNKEIGANSESNEKMDVAKSLHKTDGGCDVNVDSEACDKSATCDDSVEVDPLAYTKTEHFTSEIFKIELKNLPKHFGLGGVKKRIQNLKLDPVKVKGTGPHSNIVYVTFRNEEERKKALEALDGHTWRGCVLQAKYASAAADPLLQKRKEESRRDDRASKKQKTDDNLPLEERLRNAVAPLWATPYEDQLKTKRNDMVTFMKKLTKEIEKSNRDARKTWLEENRKLYENMCCPLEDIKASPVLMNYRNKCEFTIGVNENQERTVGFRLSSYEHGTCVAPPHDSWIVSKEMSEVVKSMEVFIRQSEYDVYSPLTSQGHWRQLTLRTSKQGDIMAIVYFHPQELSKEAVDGEKAKLKEYFCEGPGLSCHVTSLFFQLQMGRSNPGQQGGPEMEWLDGEKHVCENLLDLKFRISPDAFFQTNTLGAEVLYSTISEWCQVTPDTHILDVCCGTGTIGLTMAKKSEQVLGIEMSQPAIDDAKHNAVLNGVTNTSFHCGKAEDVLPGLMYSLTGKKVVAVVDPPRAGLHNKVVLAIRKCPYISRLVYVSCNPQGAMNNLVDFTRAPSNRVKGIPFKPVKAVPVDMFPHTKHCELVILLERSFEENQ